MKTTSTHSETNYQLQVITREGGNRTAETSYLLTDLNCGETQTFSSPDELLAAVKQAAESKPKSRQRLPIKQATVEERQIDLLEVLIRSSSFKLNQIRFSMTDRIASALTRITLLKLRSADKLSAEEQLWVDACLEDLAHLSLAIEDWNRVSELVNTKNLDDSVSITKMISTLLNHRFRTVEN